MTKRSFFEKQKKIFISKGLRFHIGQNGHLFASLSSSSGSFYLAPEVLGLLCVIADSPVSLSVENLLAKLKERQSQTLSRLPSATECLTLLEDLQNAGILFTENENHSRKLQGDGFGDPWIQWAMLADRKRSRSYFLALTKIVVPGQSVVLDLGAGTGLFSAAAFEAGAKRVIAIEETLSANVIRPLLRSMGYPKKQSDLVIFNKNSFDVPLPSEINLVVSELFGNDPFSEGILPTLRDIFARLPSQKTSCIPESIDIFCEVIRLSGHPTLYRIQALQQALVPVPRQENFYERFLSTAATHLSFESLSFPLPLLANQAQRLSLPHRILGIALNPPPSVYALSKMRQRFSLSVKEIKENALVIFWFRVYLTKSITISSHPQEYDACEHWSPIAVPFSVLPQGHSQIEVEFWIDENIPAIQCQIFQNKRRIGSKT